MNYNNRLSKMNLYLRYTILPPPEAPVSFSDSSGCELKLMLYPNILSHVINKYVFHLRKFDLIISYLCMIYVAKTEIFINHLITLSNKNCCFIIQDTFCSILQTSQNWILPVVICNQYFQRLTYIVKRCTSFR